MFHHVRVVSHQLIFLVFSHSVLQIFKKVNGYIFPNLERFYPTFTHSEHQTKYENNPFALLQF